MSLEKNHLGPDQVLTCASWGIKPKHSWSNSLWPISQNALSAHFWPCRYFSYISLDTALFTLLASTPCPAAYLEAISCPLLSCLFAIGFTAGLVSWRDHWAFSRNSAGLFLLHPSSEHNKRNVQTFSTKLKVTRVLPTESVWHVHGAAAACPGSLHSGFSSGVCCVHTLSWRGWGSTDHSTNTGISQGALATSAHPNALSRFTFTRSPAVNRQQIGSWLGVVNALGEEKRRGLWRLVFNSI